MYRISALFLVGLTAFSLLVSSPAFAIENIVLQLKWSHAYQFAGYYAAKELGYYKSAGLEVQIKPLEPGQDVVQEVILGRANFGTGTSSLLVAKQDGAPIVVLATIFQHSPYVLIARQNDGPQSIQDLAGKPILLRRLSDELLVYLRREKMPEAGIMNSSAGMNTLEEFKKGRVAAISGYISNEPYQLRQAGIPYQIFSPRAVGIDIYGDNLFTSERELKNKPERVARFRDASLRGWEYVLNHPQAVIALVQKYAPGEASSKIQFETDQLNPLIRADLVPVGFMNTQRWQHTVDIYKEAGALSNSFSLKGFIYDPNPKKDLTSLYGAFVLSLLALVILGGVMYYIVRLNKRLHDSLKQVQHMAHHDTLTSLPNRALFSDRLQRAILKAQREKTQFGLVFVDIDHFKAINDRYGHVAGDEVLKTCSQHMMDCIRHSDSLGRMGGDEFVLLLENLHTPQDALEIAKKIQIAITSARFLSDDAISTSASIGIAIFPEDAQDEEGLFSRADLAMYQAKKNGRNCICFYSDLAF